MPRPAQYADCDSRILISVVSIDITPAPVDVAGVQEVQLPRHVQRDVPLVIFDPSFICTALKQVSSPMDDVAEMQEVQPPRHVQRNVLPRAVPGEALIG